MYNFSVEREKQMSKNILKRTLAVLMSAAVVFPYAAHAEENHNTVIFVAPNGDDNNSGGIYSPLKSLEGARNRVRELRSKTDGNSDSFTVVFRGGEYKIHRAAVFEKQDSGTAENHITYRAYPGENPRFTGGIRIGAPELSAVTDSDVRSRLKEPEKVRQINIKKVFEDYYGYTVPKSYWTHTADDYTPETVQREMYAFDGEQELWPARFPNKEGGDYAEVNPRTVFMYADGSAGSQGGSLKYSGKDSELSEKIKEYAGRNNVYIYGNLIYGFLHNEMKTVISADGTMNVPSLTGTDDKVLSQRPFILFNILEELDADGEYYADPDTGMLYIYRTDFKDSDVLNIAAYTDEYMLKTYNTSFVDFEGLTFENTKGSCAYVESGDSVVFTNCSFNNIGRTAVVIGKDQGQLFHRDGESRYSKYNNSYADYAKARYDLHMSDSYSTSRTGKNHGLDSCRIMNTGTMSVKLSGGSVVRGEECNYFVRNCNIQFSGCHKRTYSGAVNISYSYGVTIEGNTLAHCPGAIINGNAYKMLIKNNDIYDGMSESYDNSLIYVNYETPTLDVKIIGNYFHDVPSEVPLTRTNIWAPPQRGAIAFDNAPMGGGITIEDNIFANLPYGVWYTNGTSVNNNVFVNVFNPIKGGGSNKNSDSDYPLKASWDFLTENRSFTDMISFETRDKIGMSVASHENYENLMSMPIFASGTVGEEQKALYRQKYPQFMDWIDITVDNKSNGLGYMNINNNLIVNVGGGTEEEPHKYDLCDYYFTPDEVKSHGVYSADGKYTIENNISTNETSMLADYENGDYSYGTAQISAVGCKGSVGAGEYSKEIHDTANVTLSAKEYEKTKIVNVTGSDVLLNEGDLVSMSVKDAQGNMIQLDQTKADKNGGYKFRFETGAENISDYKLNVYAAGRLLEKSIFATSNKNDVIKPDFSFEKTGADSVTLKVSIDNSYLIDGYTYSMIVAGYSADGKLCGTETVKAGTAIKDGITEDSQNVLLSAVFDNGEYEKMSTIYAYLWDGLNNMTPLAEVQRIK